MAVEEYNKMASYYDIVLEPFLWTMRRTIVKQSRVFPGMKVLEAACGTGTQGKRFVKAGADYTGVDLSPAMLKAAAKRRLTCIYGDASALDASSETFDLTTITLALHEVDPEIREAITREMIRVTKSSGTILLIDYTIPPTRSLYGQTGDRVIRYIEKLVGGSHYRNYLRFMKDGALLSFVKTLDAAVEETRYLFGGNIGIVTLKKE